MSSNTFSIPVLKVPFFWKEEKLSSTGKVISLGSCFSENLPRLLAGGGVKILSNPNGILYNPYSIMEAMERAVEGPAYEEKEFFFHNGFYHSFSHHGSFSSPSLPEAAAKAEKARKEFAELLPEADLGIITLSTAVVYIYNETGRITANCHKLPNGEFTSKVLSFGECQSAVKKIIALFRKVNSTAPLLFSLSPVRHNPGDPVKENHSKSLLHCAIMEELSQENKVFYFPAYEILRDELRSYRFYKEDMLHPSDLAVKIILSRFREEVCTKELNEKISLYEKAEKAASHIPRKKEEIL